MDINNPYSFHSANSPRNFLVIDQAQSRSKISEDTNNTSKNPSTQAQTQSASVNAAPSSQPSYTVSEAYKTLAEERAHSRSNKVSQVYTTVSHGNPGPNIIDTYA